MNIKKFVLIIFCFFILVACSVKEENGNTEPGKTIELNKRIDGFIRVWGFLKYYSNDVSRGKIDWDNVLIEAYPNIKNSEEYDRFNSEIKKMIDIAGKSSISQNNGSSSNGIQAVDDLYAWMDDSSVFKSNIIQQLHSIKDSLKTTSNYYAIINSIGVPTFKNETPFASPVFPEENVRILSLARFWNIINYYYPYKEGMPQDWDEVLQEFIPRFISASDQLQYNFTVVELLVHITDSHGVYYSDALNSYFGMYDAPFEIRYIENKTVITRVFSDVLEPAEAIKVGDIIVKCKNTDIDTYRANVRKYIPGSNEPTIQRNIDTNIISYTSKQIPFTVLRDGQTFDVTVTGITGPQYANEQNKLNALNEKWKILPGNIGYINMGLLQVSDVHVIMPQLINTKAIIFDVRNYPNGTMYHICSYLIPTPVPFTLISVPEPTKPGTFSFSNTMDATDSANKNYYKGKVILLVDERTQSHAEFTCMALKTVPDCTVIGSQTAGADGNITQVKLPGGIIAVFTGIGIYYPDQTPTQRIGIVPDITIRPTINGIQEGIDEILQKALDFLK